MMSVYTIHNCRFLICSDRNRHFTDFIELLKCVCLQQLIHVITLKEILVYLEK